MIRLDALATEQLMIDHLPQLAGNSGLVISPGRAQVATHLWGSCQFSKVTAWYLDLFAASAARQDLDSAIEVCCSADLPDDRFDVIAMPVLKRSEAELTRDLMQQAVLRLTEQGTLVMSVDHPADRWVHEQMQALFRKVSCHRADEGCVYWGKNSGPPRKLRCFQAKFSFRCHDRFLEAVSRPGVFAHRRVDDGARQLLRSVDIDAHDHVLDMGCGSGTLSLFAAAQTDGQVHAVDSNARSIECLQQSAELNGLTNIVAHHNADGNLELSGPVDVALANPPYYGDHSIAQHFVEVSLRWLRPGGALLVVTKSPAWYESSFPSLLEDVDIFPSGHYFVCCGRKP
ncbi:MAG: methyltransferase [Pirellulaceae bacterium]|nr:methyltransferase [Pirellulaceae bacterium]